MGPRETENMLMQNFGVTKKENYGMVLLCCRIIIIIMVLLWFVMVLLWNVMVRY